MTTDMWQPLSAREAGTGGLREHLPASLYDLLRDWIFDVAGNYPSMVQRIRLRLELSWNPGQERKRAARSRGSLGVPTPEPTDEEKEKEAREFLAYGTHAKNILDIVDAALDLLPRTVPWLKRGGLTGITAMVEEEKAQRLQLQTLLDDARVVWTIKADGSGLERRVDPIAAGMLDSAVKAAEIKSDAGSAAVQLREASDTVRALQPNAPVAYSLAIKAVESAAHAIIEPNNKKATLGTMLGILDGNPAVFEVEIPGKDRSKGSITPVTGMMRMLWEGQTSRHGSKEPTRDETREEAEMAVQLASVLVLWFSTDMVRRK